MEPIKGKKIKWFDFRSTYLSSKEMRLACLKELDMDCLKEYPWAFPHLQASLKDLEESKIDLPKEYMLQCTDFRENKHEYLELLTGKDSSSIYRFFVDVFIMRTCNGVPFHHSTNYSKCHSWQDYLGEFLKGRTADIINFVGWCPGLSFPVGIARIYLLHSLGVRIINSCEENYRANNTCKAQLARVDMRSQAEVFFLSCFNIVGDVLDSLDPDYLG